MTIMLDRIDSAPMLDEDFNPSFKVWVSNLVDSINENSNDLESAFNNGLVVPSFTTAEIVALEPTANEGTIWYCTDSIPPTLVFKSNGTLVKPTVTAFP